MLLILCIGLKMYLILQSFLFQMSDSGSREIEDDEECSSELEIVPQLGGSQARGYETSSNYVRILGHEEKIDEEAILQEFNKKREEQQKVTNNIGKIKKKKKIEKVPPAPQNKYDFGYIKMKWKAEIDTNIEKFKEYLKEEKKAYHAKEKEYLLDFFKVLIDGVYELRDLAESETNDLTDNERKIIAESTDTFAWLVETIGKFDKEFKEAKMNKKITSTSIKWVPLIKNCRDESNFELRRKIIRWKIKPVHVIQKNDEFLMSEEAKLQQERLKKLILAQADRNFEKPHEDEEEEMMEEEDGEVILENLESVRAGNHEKRLKQERDKLDEYKESVGDRPETLLKTRIEEILKGTSSYQKIMAHFKQTFFSS